MLKIHSQLGRALRFQEAFGSERTAGHFDDSAKDFAGPPTTYPYERTDARSAVRKVDVPRRKLMARVDPVSGSLVGYFSDEAA